VINSETVVSLGRAYDKQNKVKEAIQCYNKAIADPKKKNVNAYFFLGQLLEREKDFKEAVTNYRKCLKLDTEHLSSCLHLATLLAQLNEQSKAAKYFKHALKLDSTSIVANYGMGRTLHLATNNIDAPIKYYKAVVDKDPAHYKALCQLGTIYLEKMDLT
jgi:tetratricopeptide (TPR) repeat protein